MYNELRPAWVEINKNKAITNLKNIQKFVGENIKVCAVVKADSYGMGALELSKLYVENGVNMLAVAVITEALDLREEIKNTDILVLGYTPEEFFKKSINENIILTIYNYDHAKKLNDIAKNLGKFANIHIKVETGMNRLGFLPTEESAVEVYEISKLSNIKIQGIYSHFAKADEIDKTSAHNQGKKFIDFIKMLDEKNVQIPIKHLANSAAILDLPEYYFDMVRAGIILTGYYPSQDVNHDNIKIMPCAMLKAKLANVKVIDKSEGVGYGHTYTTNDETVVGTIPLGYADGYSRLLSNNGYVLIKGVKCPIIGRICMDQFMVDLSNVENPQIGDDVILYGDGEDDAMNIDDIAKARQTISYEVLTNLGKRLPRIYI